MLMSAVGTYIAISFWQRYKKQILTVIFVLIVAFVLLIAVIASVFQQQQSNAGTYGAGDIPETVQQYEPQIQKELEKYGRADQINTVLAITTQESGGTASLDIMQASESLGLPPNTIQNPIRSIQVGVKYFDETMNQAENAGVDTDTAIQSYNMGAGYIDFIADNGGEHSVELAQQFSNKMQSQIGTNVYGDPNYVENVKRYLGEPKGNNGGGNAEQITAQGELQHPYYDQDSSSYTITSEYGMRHHPVYNTSKLHAGIDLAPNGNKNLPISSAGKGVVVYSQFHHSGGNMITIKHPEHKAENGQTLYTSYLHMASPANVGVGERVDKGQTIGKTGTSGSSTGLHLHFEIHEGQGNQIEPRNYIEFSQ